MMNVRSIAFTPADYLEGLSTMKSLIASLLIFVCAASVSAQPVAPVTFSSEIRQFVMAGDKMQKRDVAVSLTADAIVITPEKGNTVTIPYTAITNAIYDRRSRVRKMAPSYGKALDHFLTVQYADASGTGAFLEMEMGKNVAPVLIATLQARSGKTIERIVGS